VSETFVVPSEEETEKQSRLRLLKLKQDVSRAIFLSSLSFSRVLSLSLLAFTSHEFFDDSITPLFFCVQASLTPRRRKRSNRYDLTRRVRKLEET
jgi:hypothetical protein